MDPNKISSICIQLNDKLDVLGLSSIRSTLENMDDSKYDAVIAAITTLKSPTTVLILSIFLGQFGVDRFVLGKVVSGICKLIFGWLSLGIWWVVDVVKAKANTRKYNTEKLMKALLVL